jgi:ADP-heptose:LPS heptosyltransferase
MPTLLYHTGALGDFITILPALTAWKNDHPDNSLTLMGRPEIGSFARKIGYVDSFIDVTLARYAPLYVHQHSTQSAEIIAPYSHAIIFSASGSTIAFHCRAAGLDVYEQPAFPPQDRTHVVDYHVSLFRDIGSVPARQRMPRVRVPQEFLEASFSLCPPGEKYAVVHAGSGSPKKNWHIDRFVRIADMLRRQGETIVWIKGPAESSMPKAEGGADRIVQNPPLSVLAALLERAEFFLGNDSGVAHLAAAAGCPSLVLFGPSDPQVWAPRGDRVKILYNKVPCSPCHLTCRESPDGRGSQDCGRTCLDGISVEQAAQRLFAPFP